MKELNLEFLKGNYELIDKIAEDVAILKNNDSKYILKRITIPMTYETVLDQHRYIKYLHENGIKTAKIYGCYQTNGDIYELQEYIERNNSSELDTTNLIKCVAKYHSISSKYAEGLQKENIYKCSFTCGNTKLNMLLLGFKEKYYIYPKKNLITKSYLINDKNKQYINKIITIYENSYEYFINNYSIDNCIIHNDITSNNVIISNKELYIIDFDLAIRSSIYVDFVDCAIKRYNDLETIRNNLDTIKYDIIKYIDIYNSNNILNIELPGVLCVFIMKLISFNSYVLLSEESYESFNNNMQALYEIVGKTYEFLMEVKNDKKSQKRRCR